VRIVAFGTYRLWEQPRVQVLFEGLREHGHELVECNVPLAVDTVDRVKAAGQPLRAPLVAARVARVWDFFHPIDHQLYGYFEGRSRWAGKIGLGFLYPLLVLAVAGAVVLRRRGAPLWPLLALPALVTITAALVYGYTRFRFAAEPALVVLAAAAIDAAIARRGRSRPGPASDRAALARA